jgi:hypothetical protein
MTFQPSESRPIDAETLKQLKSEIQQEVRASLKNVDFGNLLQKYGISGDDILQFECNLDLTKVSLSSTLDSLGEALGSKLNLGKYNLLVDCWCPRIGVCPCPCPKI